MNLLDSLVKIAQTKIKEQTQSLTKKIEEQAENATKKFNAMPENIVKKLETIGQPKPAKVETPKQNRLAKNIINRFYANYSELPYVSNDRPKDWIERAEMFPKQCIIPKSIMERYSDGLLPGHIYMLYWLKKYTNQKVPSYFEYKYGIDFQKEKLFLFENGFIDDLNKPTEKGRKAITEHYTVIENHSQKADTSKEGISKEILAQRDSMRRNGFKEYEFIANNGCCETCAALNGKHFLISNLKIGVNAPPMHEGCRCSIAAYEDDTAYNEWLNKF